MTKITRAIGILSALVVAMWLSMASLPVSAQSGSRVALSGTVTSQAEGIMEGVVVSARRDGANMTVSVVTDARGRYTFPRTHLEPGPHAVTIRAAGFELPAPAKTAVTRDKAAVLDLALQSTSNLLPQLTSLEIAMSLPG